MEGILKDQPVGPKKTWTPDTVTYNNNNKNNIHKNKMDNKKNDHKNTNK